MTRVRPVITAAATCGLLVLPVVLAPAVAAADTRRFTVRAPLSDLGAAAAPTDGAMIRVRAVVHPDETVVRIRLRDLGAAADGKSYGAHVHSGPCVAGDGAAAGPHYNDDVADGVTPPEVSADTEVWLDFTVDERGRGSAVATVPFAVETGAAASIVVHEKATAPDGEAGGRLACVDTPF